MVYITITGDRRTGKTKRAVEILRSMPRSILIVPNDFLVKWTCDTFRLEKQDCERVFADKHADRKTRGLLFDTTILDMS